MDWHYTYEENVVRVCHSLQNTWVNKVRITNFYTITCPGLDPRPFKLEVDA